MYCSEMQNITLEDKDRREFNKEKAKFLQMKWKNTCTIIYKGE